MTLPNHYTEVPFNDSIEEFYNLLKFVGKWGIVQELLEAEKLNNFHALQIQGSSARMTWYSSPARD